MELFLTSPDNNVIENLWFNIKINVYENENYIQTKITSEK